MFELNNFKYELEEPQTFEEYVPWYANLNKSTGQQVVQKAGYVPQNGDIVEIDSKKNSKYGHTAVFYNGKWYSDFEQKQMNPYNDPNAKIRIFRNDDTNFANLAASIAASRAGKKSTHKCAKAVRESLNIASGGNYRAEGYNGNNFGDYLQRKQGWTQIAQQGMKFATYDAVRPPQQVGVTELPSYQTILPTFYKQYEQQQQQSQQITNKPVTQLWYENLGMPQQQQDYRQFTNKFIQTMYDAYKRKGLSDNQALVLASQDALETGYGKSLSGKNNFGGIKGKGTLRKTKEEINGKLVSTVASFKDFNSLDDYVESKIKLIGGSKYRALDTDDPATIISSIIKGGYATDSKYADKLLSIYNKYV